MSESNQKLNLLIAKAVSDPAFLKQLEDPKKASALLKEYGVTLPEGVKLQFIKEPENTKIIVIPNTDKLSGVSGGDYWSSGNGDSPF